MEGHRIFALKNALREQLTSATEATAFDALLLASAGKIAERLRRLLVYRNASSVLVPPTALFRQTGVNVLLDGKNLVFSSPQMHQGFYLVNPQRIPRPQRAAAASFRSPNPWARRIVHRGGEKVRVDLLLMPCLSASRDGGRLGDGSGLMDLQVACLGALGWLHPRTAVVGIVPEANLLDTIPMKSTDVFLHWIITEHRTLQTTWHDPVQVPIVWELLDKKTLRRIDVLFFLKGQKISSST
ncbi:MAG: 5-formyltetrahydrofolate cyclo-ligase [Desulfosoma sp.]|uniref:5-formyltetrahydrofolate cyclo-ligase n=1 Tax=Desulfosoma sp. TaxID=2603217 RepID=UPI00404A301C